MYRNAGHTGYEQRRRSKPSFKRSQPPSRGRLRRQARVKRAVLDSWAPSNAPSPRLGGASGDGPAANGRCRLVDAFSRSQLPSRGRLLQTNARHPSTQVDARPPAPEARFQSLLFFHRSQPPSRGRLRRQARVKRVILTYGGSWSILRPIVSPSDHV
jgi:hypothetical protein